MNLEGPFYSSMNVSNLKVLLKERTLTVTGKKQDLIDRLEQSDRDRDRANGLITIQAKTLMGSYYTIKIHFDSTIQELCNIIIAKHPVGKQIKLYTTDRLNKIHYLDDNLKLSDYNLSNSSIVSIHQKLC